MNEQNKKLDKILIKKLIFDSFTTNKRVNK